MKRILTTLALAATISFTTMAQVNPNDKEYLHPREDGKIERLYTQDFYHFDVETLEKFHQEWEDYTRRHPTDEIGWRNYEQVWRSYMMERGWPKEANHPLYTEWYRRLAESIPNTYTYYYLMTDYFLDERPDGEKDYQRAAYDNDCKAMELLPDDVTYLDMTSIINVMLDNFDTLRTNKLLFEIYDRNLISQNVLQYHFNELQGMPDSALYIGNWNGNIIPKLIIQRVLGLHRDKIFYNQGDCTDKAYNAAFFKKYGIPECGNYDEWIRSHKTSDYNYKLQYEWHKKVVQHICDNSPRPVCFSANGMSSDWLTDSLRARLYNEGLTMRYSATPYDNFAVKRRNINQRYHLEYLLYPFKKQKTWNRSWSWGDGADNDGNYIGLLKDQLPWYKKHDRKGYERLVRLFVRIFFGQGTLEAAKIASLNADELPEGMTMQIIENYFKEIENFDTIEKMWNWKEQGDAAFKALMEAKKNAETPTKQEKK